MGMGWDPAEQASKAEQSRAEQRESSHYQGNGCGGGLAMLHSGAYVATGHGTGGAPPD